MAGRKTRRQKEEIRRRKEKEERFKLLEQERKTILQKQDELKDTLHHDKKIKNLNIFKNTFRLLYPYCLIYFGVQIPALIFHGGLPFVLDTHTIYKEQVLNTSYEGDIDYQEGYVSDNWDDERTYPNKLTITSPWVEYEDGVYAHTISEYKIEYDEAIVNAIFAQDYENLLIMLDEPKSEIFETSNVKINDNSYHVEGELGHVDHNYSLEVLEDDFTNKFVTIFDLSLFFVFALVAFKVRSFKYKKELKAILEEYKNKKLTYLVEQENLDRDLQRVDERIKQLTR